jgi:coenzyme F420-dependent glucose-6-phosphate dehydrogenase
VGALTLGYKASADQFGPRELLDFAVHAESAGFDTVAVSDHFHGWRHDGGHGVLSLVWLAALAERTSRVRFGPSVVTPTLRYHPGVVAQAMGTLDQLAPGRVFLGVGTGEAKNEIPLGIAWPGFKERFRRLKEAVEIMRRLWVEDFVSFDGDYFQIHEANVYDKPTGYLPIYVAGTGQRAARYAGEVADGYICASGLDMALYRETLLPAVAEGAERAGRSPSDILLTVEMQVSFDTDEQRALDATRNWAGLSLTHEQRLGVHDPREMDRRSADLPIAQVARRWIISTDPDEHVARLEPYLNMGFRHVLFRSPTLDQHRFIDLYAEHILPRLRQWQPRQD